MSPMLAGYLFVGAIPDYRIVSRLVVAIEQGFDRLPEDIVDNQSDIGALRNGDSYYSRRV